MNTPSKPFASLSPSLLARKGAARPAMRPQLQPLRQFHEATARQLNEDLGWNDMGHDRPETEAEAPPSEAQLPENVAQAEEAPAAEIVPFKPAEPAPVVALPEVVRLRAEAVERIAATPKRRSALAEGRRAAFTLRLDAERHLKLRLACVVAGQSAQQIVTAALDRLIGEMSDVETLSEQVRKSGGK